MLVTRLPVLDREQDLVGISTVIYEAYEEDIFCASRAGLHCWHLYESTPYQDVVLAANLVMSIS